MSTPFYDLASLVVVPSGYKASKVYAQKPLTTDGQLTFSRASTATRVNSAGLIETVSSNVPRLDYLGSTCPRLLLEPQRTNLVTYSEQFDNAAWLRYLLSVTANAVISPDGTQNADTLISNSPSTASVYTNLVLTGTYTLSAYFKAGTSASSFIDLPTGGGANFNLTSKTYETFGTVLSASITDVGNGWRRCSVTAAVSSTPYIAMGINGSVGTTLHIWGAMLEQGAYATSYVKTTSSSVTRLADDLGTINMAVLTPGSAYSFFFEITESALTTASSWMFLGSSTGSGDPFQIYGGTAILNTSSGYVYPFSYGTPSNASGKVCVSYNGTTVAVFLNGVKQGQWTASTIWANKTTLDLTRDLVQKINYKKVLTFPSALTDAQAIELTTL